MPNWMKDVYSSMVREVGYDEESKSMIVVWTNGRKSAYEGVDEGLAIQCATAPSVGSMINQDIKGKYPHRYI